MKIKFLATYDSPDRYEFNGETITAYYKQFSDTVDLSSIQEGEFVRDFSLQNIPLEPSLVFEKAERVNGELIVTLAQTCPMSGDWRESELIDILDYIPERKYIRQLKDGVLITPVFEEDYQVE